MKVRKGKKARNSNKNKQPVVGYSKTELVERISKLYGMKPNKTLRQKVALALRRGVSYGILVKCRNRYRYDPETSLLNSFKNAGRRRKRILKFRRVPEKDNSPKKPQKPPQPEKQPEQREPPPTIPRPTVPPPPNWQPKRRNLTTEPFKKIIKHSKTKKQEHQ